jgi:alkane 1-monooxygenase
VVPILDILIGRDIRNLSSKTEKIWDRQIGFRALTWICAPLQVVMVFWGAGVLKDNDLNFIEITGFVFSIGISSGVMGINVAHELSHRVNEKLEPFLGKSMLWTVFYMHWGLEHVVGHHRNVATPEDPATARIAESFYRFWPRTILGSFNSAWEFEKSRLIKSGASIWSLKNRLMMFFLGEIFLIILFAFFFGLTGIFFLFAQSFIAISLLEVINYIEHYGLVRRRDQNGQYEPVKPRHSWNSSNWLTNRFLFNLQRHSDHHYKPGSRYQLLRHHDESPQLPTGYAGMVLVALIPPLWRFIMDKRVKAFHIKDGERF